jgi:hypothetical protein
METVSKNGMPFDKILNCCQELVRGHNHPEFQHEALVEMVQSRWISIKEELLNRREAKWFRRLFLTCIVFQLERRM